MAFDHPDVSFRQLQTMRLRTLCEVCAKRRLMQCSKRAFLTRRPCPQKQRADAPDRGGGGPTVAAAQLPTTTNRRSKAGPTAQGRHASAVSEPEAVVPGPVVSRCRNLRKQSCGYSITSSARNKSDVGIDRPRACAGRLCCGRPVASKPPGPFTPAVPPGGGTGSSLRNCSIAVSM
jgi:hypothetical protein